MCCLHSWYLNMFDKFVLLLLLSVIIFELVLCSTHDVHRIVLKSHHRKNRDRDNYRYHPDHRQIRKPLAQAAIEDEWPSETTKPVHRYHNYRPNHKNESNDGDKRRKSRNYTTVQPQPLFNIADIVEFTTMYSEKLPIPIIESTFKNYYQYNISNNSLDLHAYTGPKRQNLNFNGKVRQLRDKEIFKNVSKGYEVYEEIIGDISPPPPHSLLVNNVQPVPIVTTISPTIITQKDEENRIKENTPDYPAVNNKTYYGKRTKSRRNRGHVKFE